MKYAPPIGSADPNATYTDPVEGTVPAAAIEQPMREIAGVIQAAGLVPSETDLTQLDQAIDMKVAAVQPDLSEFVTREDLAEYVTGLPGMRALVLEALDPSGCMEVELSRYGIAPREEGWFPNLQMLGAAPYLALARDIRPEGFTLGLFFPDGTPGIRVSSGVAECGSGLACGSGAFCGQGAPIRGVRVGCLVPM